VVNASVLITAGDYLSGDISLQNLLALMGDTLRIYLILSIKGSAALCLLTPMGDTLRGVAATFMALGRGCGLA